MDIFSQKLAASCKIRDLHPSMVAWVSGDRRLGREDELWLNTLLHAMEHE